MYMYIDVCIHICKYITYLCIYNGSCESHAHTPRLDRARVWKGSHGFSPRMHARPKTV